MRKLIVFACLLVGSVAQAKSTCYNFDFGQKIKGWKSVEVKIPAETKPDELFEGEITAVNSKKEGLGSIFSCYLRADDKAIVCYRDDDGGRLTVLPKEKDSAELSFTYFDMRADSEKSIPIRSPKEFEAVSSVGKSQSCK